MPYEDPLLIPNPVGEKMPNLPSELAMEQLSQSGVIAQNNFITTTKAQDLDYLEGKRLVTLEEAVGIREVSSKEVPAGPSVPRG